MKPDAYQIEEMVRDRGTTLHIKRLSPESAEYPLRLCLVEREVDQSILNIWERSYANHTVHEAIADIRNIALTWHT